MRQGLWSPPSDRGEKETQTDQQLAPSHAYGGKAWEVDPLVDPDRSMPQAKLLATTANSSELSSLPGKGSTEVARKR